MVGSLDRGDVPDGADRRAGDPAAPRIVPVVLAGGRGTRLWPISRADMPKQFVTLVGDRSPFQTTLERMRDPAVFDAPLIICSAEHRHIVEHQTAALGVTPKAIVLEPQGRNTAPAIALATGYARAFDRADAVLLIAPSDHLVEDDRAFVASVRTGLDGVARGKIVTLGVPAAAPETGYGYIRPGAPVGPGSECRLVDAFVEKPDPGRARALLAEGGHLWNCGLFLASVETLEAEFRRWQPGLLDGAVGAVRGGRTDGVSFSPDADVFASLDADSFDYAVMEKTENAAVCRGSFGWSDLGTWRSVSQMGAGADGNMVAIGDVVAIDTNDSYIHANSRLVTVLGATNLVVVETQDAVLVADRGRTEDVKSLVERLDREARNETRVSAEHAKPWGGFRVVERGDGYQVKRIRLTPGGSTSLQRHRRRTERWTVIAGRGEAIVDEQRHAIAVADHVAVPQGALHRLVNTGAEDLVIIEVQTGAYLGEDDIERIEDAYGRVEPPRSEGAA
jgi:mannose-1-phosphate guanylyltransferase/mannose-6-phosphate isomerase